ncbi:MAG: hypothetical protein A2X13_07670 [Bacteroidetes bacterium GWC2_33_15]|nr:MAG: hypothetical protein A2X10_01525 [Bacteroidetes bacterium GWA2_33_15]OFX48664.1 MAG: hypothetical protein A2X13_07670 [Bacteroidetes bacterium GWC2_33_15]OFX64638.1 MAG: hypothetical protein A2X15_05260 [Bacteroidetes bacterium GWB2_32_14]OFX67944.1 MAG: hypothetical protein A2X14_01515 [Bacteroidetes bacterium GWD2_33_33]HAN18175.1 hypothetical protein [Bacteroidales bacterium]
MIQNAIFKNIEIQILNLVSNELFLYICSLNWTCSIMDTCRQAGRVHLAKEIKKNVLCLYYKKFD